MSEEAPFSGLRLRSRRFTEQPATTQQPFPAMLKKNITQKQEASGLYQELGKNTESFLVRQEALGVRDYREENRKEREKIVRRIFKDNLVMMKN